MDTSSHGWPRVFMGPTIRKNCTWFPCPTPGTLWIPPLKQYRVTMNTRQFPNKIYLGCWWFWGKIFGKRVCPTPQSRTGRQVQSHHIMGWKLYIGISLQWDYEKVTVQICVSWYVHAALHSFQHKKLKRLQDSPYPWTQPIYGNDNQTLNEKTHLNNWMKSLKTTPEDFWKISALF